MAEKTFCLAGWDMVSSQLSFPTERLLLLSMESFSYGARTAAQRPSLTIWFVGEDQTCQCSSRPVTVRTV
eukprot:471400-Hanusia_phi.AAC.7